MEKQVHTNSAQASGDDFRCGKCGRVLARANSFTDPRSSARAFIEAVNAHRCSSAPTRR